MIALDGITRTYRKGAAEIRALDRVSLTVAPGEFVAVMGPSGSGKSTLMNLLGLLDTADSGSYTLEGRDVRNLSADERAAVRNQRIGFVFQAFHLLPRTTAEENVELPLVYAERPAGKGAGRKALARVGLVERAGHTPSELSGGEQQRVAIARALVQQPALLLADEPTGNLDSAAGAEVLALFRRLNQDGATVVMITHDPTVASHAGRIVRMADGRVASDR
jgi:putative ABC transport system ATP-binding protein